MSATPEQIAIDEKALEAAAIALCYASGNEPFLKFTDGRIVWKEYEAITRAAITAYLSATKDAQAERVRVLEGALLLIANATHPRFRTEDDIDLLYANEKAFGDCINIARAALKGEA